MLNKIINYTAWYLARGNSTKIEQIKNDSKNRILKTLKDCLKTKPKTSDRKLAVIFSLLLIQNNLDSPEELMLEWTGEKLRQFFEDEVGLSSEKAASVYLQYRDLNPGFEFIYYGFTLKEQLKLKRCGLNELNKEISI